MVILMDVLLETYCPHCESNTLHHIYINEYGYLVCLCTKCGNIREGKTVKKLVRIVTQKEDKKIVAKINYIDSSNYMNWFNCVTGKNIEGKKVNPEDYSEFKGDIIVM